MLAISVFGFSLLYHVLGKAKHDVQVLAVWQVVEEGQDPDDVEPPVAVRSNMIKVPSLMPVEEGSQP